MPKTGGFSFSNVPRPRAPRSLFGSVIIPVALRVFCAILGIFKSMQRDCHGKIISSYR